MDAIIILGVSAVLWALSMFALHTIIKSAVRQAMIDIVEYMEKQGYLRVAPPSKDDKQP